MAGGSRFEASAGTTQARVAIDAQFGGRSYVARCWRWAQLEWEDADNEMAEREVEDW